MMWRGVNYWDYSCQGDKTVISILFYNGGMAWQNKEAIKTLFHNEDMTVTTRNKVKHPFEYETADLNY